MMEQARSSDASARLTIANASEHRALQSHLRR
jgi:hypothetical protein